MIIVSKYDLFLTFPVGEIWKIRLYKTVILHKNLECAEFTHNKYGNRTLHSLIVMCSRCLSDSNSSVYVLKRNMVLLWWFWIGFLFVFIEACSHDTTCIIGFFCIIMLKPKKWFMNHWIWKELCTSQNKTLSAFSLAPHVQVSQTLARSSIEFIHWDLNKFSIELNRTLVKSAVNWFYYCTVKDLLFSEAFDQLFDWQQPGYAKHVAN